MYQYIDGSISFFPLIYHLKHHQIIDFFLGSAMSNRIKKTQYFVLQSFSQIIQFLLSYHCKYFIIIFTFFISIRSFLLFELCWDNFPLSLLIEFIRKMPLHFLFSSDLSKTFTFHPHQKLFTFTFHLHPQQIAAGSMLD